MALAANGLQHILPTFDPTSTPGLKHFPLDTEIEETEEELLFDEDFDVESEEQIKSEVTISTSTVETTPSIAFNPPENLLRPVSPTISQERPSSPSLQDVPSLVLTFNSNTYFLFSPHSTSTAESAQQVLFTDQTILYKAPLQHLMCELQKHFSIATDVTLDFPELQLSFGLNMIYAQKVTLAHVHLLTQGLENHIGKSVPFKATLIAAPNAFLSQYNHLIELAQRIPSKHNVVFTSSTTGIPTLNTQPETTSSEITSAVTSNSETTEQLPSESNPETETEQEVEVDPEEVTENDSNVDSETNAINENEINLNETENESMQEEDLAIEDETKNTVELEEEKQDNSVVEDVDVEFDEINADLSAPGEVVFKPSHKLHARRWDDDHDVNEVEELQRKKLKLITEEDNSEQGEDLTEST